MSKSENTQLLLEEALKRILEGAPLYVHKSRKLSIRSLEQEARLGDGSAYYYPELIALVKSEIKKRKVIATASPQSSKSKSKLASEKRLKEKYRSEVHDLKKKLSLMAAGHNELSYSLHQAHQTIEEQKKEIKSLMISKIKPIR